MPAYPAHGNRLRDYIHQITEVPMKKLFTILMVNVFLVASGFSQITDKATTMGKSVAHTTKKAAKTVGNEGEKATKKTYHSGKKYTKKGYHTSKKYTKKGYSKGK